MELRPHVSLRVWGFGAAWEGAGVVTHGMVRKASSEAIHGGE